MGAKKVSGKKDVVEKKSKKAKDVKTKVKEEKQFLDLSPEVVDHVNHMASVGKEKLKKAEDLVKKAETFSKFSNFATSGIELYSADGDGWDISDPDLVNEIKTLCISWHSKKVEECKNEAEKLMDEVLL